MKRTLLFSNVIGDILSPDCVDNCDFNDYMKEYLVNNYANETGIVFIDAPDYPNEDKFYETILTCFKKIGIEFERKLYIGKNTTYGDIINFDRSNCIYFLMGGNPLTQYEVIKGLNMVSEIKNYDGLVIGMCAGAINLSKYSIITTDDDFPNPTSYLGINRIDLSIEPHYNQTEDIDFLQRRNDEINSFCNRYNTAIHAIPDTSIIIVENELVIEKGTILKFVPAVKKTI